MSRAGTIARRTFLIGSAAVAGGVAFGAYRYLLPLPNPLTAQAGEAALNPFVLIRADGVTLIVPRADKGQGIASLQAHLIAEELDVDPADCRLDPGPPAPAYYNGAVAGEGLPFQPTDRGWLAETARAATDIPARLLGIQITGGSSSVPDLYDRLREAGAVARETLKEAAAQLHGVARADLRTEAGAVILPDGTQVAYSALAAKAAKIAPVTQVVLRAPSQWRFLGKPMRRTDTLAKVTGAQVYGMDVRLPDMVFASVRCAPFGGTATVGDTAAVAAMPGVLKVAPVRGGVGVIARDTWTAMRAVAAVPMEATPREGWSGEQAQVWEALAAAFDGKPDSTGRSEGDLGDLPIRAEYRTPFLAHAPMEVMNATVLWHGDSCDIWTGTQVPRFMQDKVAAHTGLAREAVRIHAQMIGGSFGHRLELDYIYAAVDLARAMPGVPVQTVLSREEDFAQDFPRPAQMARMAGRVSNGKIEALDIAVAGPSIMQSWFGRVSTALPGPDGMITAGSWDQPFAIPAQRMRGFRAAETQPVSSWRSVGASNNGFFFGSFLDELFEAAGIDPMAGLIDLCTDDVSRAVLEAVRDLSGWQGRALPDAGEGPRGRGVAFCWSFGVPCAEVVEATQTARGLRIDRAFAVADVGRVLDPVNAEAQLSGGMLFGLGHALNAEVTYREHRPEQVNYHRFAGMRMHQAPEVQVKLLENGALRGLGEPGVPPAAPALANAVFAATGVRVRELPISRAMGVA